MKFFVAALLCSTLGISSADIKPLTVEGNQVLIGGSPGALVGNSLFWTNSGWGGEKFYNAKCVQWLKKDWNSNLVRAAMGVEEGGGYLQDPQNNLARVKAVIEAAIAAEMYVIVDWHSHCANQHQDEAIKFFQEIAKCYGNNTNIIYEIWNEPKDDVSWSANVKPYAVAVIKAIREIDNNNLIVVGSPHWSQDVDAAAADPITGYKNIAYSLHFYAGSHHQELRDKAAAALKKIPLFVTEWGAVNADGNGCVNQDETNKWIEFMKANNISNANWSLNDKPEGASSLKSGCHPEGEWNDSDLTESGTFVRNVIKQWSPNSASNSNSNASANSGSNSYSNSSQTISRNPANTDVCSCCVCNCPSISSR